MKPEFLSIEDALEIHAMQLARFGGGEGIRDHGLLESALALQDAFEFRGERYRSLSAIAKEITGTSWNGFLWFGLEKRSRKKGNGK